jgi:hypothetical protein
VKRFVFFVLIAFLGSTTVQVLAANTRYSAQSITTKAGGSLKADEGWTAAGGPYQVTGTITVPTGRTLTIEAGTSVYLNSGVSLTVANGGRILAEGTETQQIRFTRPPGTTSSWGGITINGAVNSPETRMAYVYFEGNGNTCIEAAAGTLYLDHATFGTTTHQYVSLDGASFLISHCHFPSGTSGFELLHGASGIKSGGRGIVRDSFFGSTIGYNDAMDFTGGNRDQSQPIIQYYNNVFMGSSDDILDLDGTDAWIEGNIFLHSHRNGAPDTSSAVSGGNNGGRTSEITILGNLFFDCDNAATAKQGNFFTLINNTIIRMTKKGGMDFASGVVVVRDTTPSPTAFGAGFYLEGNIIADAEQLVRNYDANQTSVTFNNNVLPMPWNGPGSGNIVVDPQLKHVPQVSETYFTSWEEAQVMRDWFSLRSGSAALGAGPNGTDMGGVIPLGVSVSGEPPVFTNQTSATLTIGVNRAGSGIPAAGFPLGSGFTHYKWRLDTGAWSAETPIATPIKLANLSDGSHHVEVVGKNDAGWYQNDSALGTDAVVTSSRTWTVDHTYSRLVINEVLARGDAVPNAVELYYEGPSPLDLSGMKMTRDPNGTAWFTMPSQTRMSSGQYLVLYAGANTTPSGIHLGFTLDEKGDGIYLYDKRGVLIDSVAFGQQLPDLSIGRIGYDDYWHLTIPTLGKANIACPLDNPDVVKINEWLTNGRVPSADDFVELYNPQENPVDLEGLYLADSNAAPLAVKGMSPLSFMAAKGFDVFWSDKSGHAGRSNLHLSAGGGMIDLFNGESEQIDSILYGRQAVGVSQGRVPDGGDMIESLPMPTPGAENWPGIAVVTVATTFVKENADKRVLVPTSAISDDWKGGGAFNDSAWLLCTGSPGGVGYERDSGYQSLITLNTEAQMYGSGKNNTCYIRVPFVVDANALSDAQSLTLSVRCDDGFVCYLNGTEVARSNFTGTPAWNSHADSSIEASVTSFDAVVDVTAYKDQLKAGANILAVHGMNSSSTSSDFLISVALDAVRVTVQSLP